MYNISDPYQMFGATSSRLASSGKLNNYHMNYEYVNFIVGIEN